MQTRVQNTTHAHGSKVDAYGIVMCVCVWIDTRVGGCLGGGEHWGTRGGVEDGQLHPHAGSFIPFVGHTRARQQNKAFSTWTSMVGRSLGGDVERRRLLRGRRC